MATDRSSFRFAGAPSGLVGPTRLASHSDGRAGAPIGWRVALRNGAASVRPFQAAAICAPEPGSTLEGATALLVQFVRRRSA